MDRVEDGGSRVPVGRSPDGSVDPAVDGAGPEDPGPQGAGPGVTGPGDGTTEWLWLGDPPTTRADRVRSTREERRRRRTRRVCTGLAAALLVAVSAVTVTRVVAAATSASSGHVPAAAPPGSPPPPAVPTSSAYFGAFVAPHEGETQAQSDVRLELAQLGNFSGALGRPLGLVHVYQPWSNPVKVATLAALASTGATPVIDWTCTSDVSIANGSQDALITSYATALKSYGRPLFLRWFWEMNLVALPRASGCLGAQGSVGYIQAWQHIWTIFHSVGATNVAFVWCPSINAPATAAADYPGDAFVD